MGTCINNQAQTESMPKNYSQQYIKLTQVYAKQQVDEIKEQVAAFKQMQKMILPQQILLPDWKINQNYQIEKQPIIGEEIQFQGFDCLTDGQQFILNQITLQPKQFIMCQAFAQQPLQMITQFDLNISGYITWRGLKLYNLGASDYQNEHFDDELKGDYIIQINVNQENSLNQLLQDFRLGFNPMSYNSLRTHIKRRGLKQKHLWVFFKQLQNSQVACNLFIELIENIQVPVDELIKNIVQGFNVNHYQRLACLHDFNLSKEDQRYLCSSQIIQDVIQSALSHPIVLVRSLQQRFGIQVKREYLIKMSENVNYFISSEFINNYKFIEKTNILYQNLRQKEPHQCLIEITQKQGYEIYLPLVYYNYNYRYFIQDDSIIIQIINSKNIQEDERNRYKLLQMIQNKQPYTIETNNKAHQLLNLIIISLYEKTTDYDQLISFTQKCFGDQTNRSSIKHNIISYIVDRQNQTGYNIKEWLIKRYNDLIDEQLDFVYHNNQNQSQSDILVWGLNDSFQLAQSQKQIYKIPQTLQIQISFTSVACGYKHTLALSVFKNVYCWGCNEYGKCGVFNQKFVKFPENLQNFDNVAQICAGYDHSCLLQENGQVYCWGHGDGGLIGNSQQIDYHIPQKTLIDGPVQRIISGGLHNTAISDGFVYQWGRGEAGQLGQHVEYIVTPYKHQLQNIVDIASGESHNLALDSNGNVWGWGNGEYGQLVIETQCQLEPIIICTDVQKIFASSLFSYFIKNNTLYGCGNDFSDKRELREIVSLDIQQLCGSQNHIIYSTETGLYGWGLNRYGELAQTSGQKVEKILNQETQSISCGGYHTVVITGRLIDHKPKLKRTKSIQF